MSADILITKFFIPAPRENHIPRPGLLEKLQGAWDHELTLVSAPAGFGKSTLVGEWARQQDQTVCWLSLDEEDNDPDRFLRYLHHALGPVEEAAGPLSAESAAADPLTALLNQLSVIRQPFALVLDDYHLITNPDTQETMRFLLDHLPARMRLVISSRADPPWPMGRLRARGGLLEIRADALRFTRKQTSALLEKTVGRKFSEADIAALDRRTEGWAAGLHLAGLSMRSQQDIGAFIRSFTGSHRFLMDYLLEEILDQQPAHLRTFLLSTSVLKRFSAPLCDAIMQREDSRQVLADLEAGNLFIQPLDEHRLWYRYHHLFADLLQNQLKQERSQEALQDLHRRAGRWYETSGLLPDAIRHAVAADDLDMIVRLTENLALFSMDYEEFGGLVDWLGRLGEDVYRRSPWLYVIRALAFSRVGHEQRIDEEAERVEAALSDPGVDPEMALHVRGQMAAVQSYLAELREDAPVAIRKAREALALIPESDAPLRCYVSIRLANCLVWSGEIEQAIGIYRNAGALGRKAGDDQSMIVALSEANIVRMFSGSMRTALDEIEELRAYAERLAARDGRQLPAMGVLYRHLSHIRRERNELEEAVRCAEQALQISRRWGEREAILFATLALARARVSQGEISEAEALLDRCRWTAGRISPKVAEFIHHWMLYLQLLQGRWKEAAVWAEQVDLSHPGDFSYADHLKYEVYGRCLLASGDPDRALQVAQTLMRVSGEAGDRYTRLRAGTLQALILDALGRKSESLALFEDVLAGARAGGFVRVILDEGPAVEGLLHRAIVEGREAAYAGLLLEQLRQAPWPFRADLDEGGGPLSEREMDVLRLLATTLSVPEIAEELIVAPSTVRSHVKNIYAQLDVHSRAEAVGRARELRLI